MKANRRIKKAAKVRDYSLLKTTMRYCRIAIVLSFLTVTIGVAGFYSVGVAEEFLNRPVTEVVIDSRFNYVTEEDVSQIVDSMIGRSFVGENIDNIKLQVESIAWVDNVNLARQWPDRLVVSIDEHKPIARWGDEGFVNVRGELIFTGDTERLSHLSTLHGDMDSAVLIMQQYSVLAKLLQPYSLVITSLQRDRRGAWQLRLDNDAQVMLGRGDVQVKIQRLTQLLDQRLLSRFSDVAVIDMRYQNGIAVQWIDNENEETVSDVINKETMSSGVQVNVEHAQNIVHIRG